MPTSPTVSENGLTGSVRCARPITNTNPKAFTVHTSLDVDIKQPAGLKRTARLCVWDATIR